MLPIEAQITLNQFTPRPYQLPLCIAFEQKKYKKLFAVWARRSGKDYTIFNLILRAALRKVGSYFYCLPTFKQARLVIWDAITMDGVRFLDCVPKELIKRMNSQELLIELINGSQLRLIGSDTYDTSLVGTNPCCVVLSEFALADSRAYTYLRPILNANDGTVIIASTPRGKNFFYDLYQIAKNNPKEWYCEKLSVSDTHHIPIELIKNDIANGEMSEEKAQQEYYCFPESQSVLTSDSVKNISDIGIGEFVISHTGRPRKVLKTMSRPYTGPLIEIQSYGSYDNIVCTKDHPIRVYNPFDQTYLWKKACEITLEDFLVFPKMIMQNRTPVISKELCMLLAWYICDGSSFDKGLQISVNIKKVDRIVSLFKALNIECRVINQKGEKVFNIVVYSTQFVDFFKVHCGTNSYDKRIDFTLIQGYEDEFFHELMMGDGCHFINETTDKFSFSTTSKTLAYQIQLLANSLNKNYATGISTRPARVDVILGREVNCALSYQVAVHVPLKNRKRKFNFLRRAKNCVAAKIIEIKEVQYEGSVYNLEVQYDNSYLVGGRAVHNCSFELGVEGSYYGRYIDKMRLEGRIGEVPYEPAYLTHTAWDLGMRDSTVIIFFQVIGAVIHIIDCYENHSQGLEHYAKVIRERDYMYGEMFAPHDIEVRELGTGLSRKDKGYQMGLDFSVVPNLSIMDGIEACRTMLPRCWIDERKCAPLIKALENYHKEFDNIRRVYNDRPAHDSSSHMADAARYMALSVSSIGTTSTPEELKERYYRVRYGGGDNLPREFRKY